MGIENPEMTIEIDQAQDIEHIVIRTGVDLGEARNPSMEGENFGSSCSNSGNGCTGSCNHSSK